MIVDEKCFYLPPPPPYPERPLSVSSRGLSLTSLPAHLLLHIVFSTFPSEDGQFEGDSKLELQRQNLHWIHSSLRFVNRAFYLACMNILRSAYLPVYDYNIRVPYSSDPFPSTASSTASIQHRELHTLDLFIALLSHEDVLLDASSLHLPREEAYKDLFDLIQPRSRLEGTDLVAEQGRNAGVIILEDNDTYSGPPTPIYSTRKSTGSITKSEYPTNPSSSSSGPYSFSPPLSTTSIALTRPPAVVLSASLPKPRSSFFSSLIPKSLKGKSKSRTEPCTPPLPASRKIRPLSFSCISVAFSPRKVGLVYTPPPPTSHNGSTVTGLARPGSSIGGRKRTLVEVARTREDSLELTARRLVGELRLWLEEDTDFHA